VSRTVALELALGVVVIVVVLGFGLIFGGSGVSRILSQVGRTTPAAVRPTPTPWPVASGWWCFSPPEAPQPHRDRHGRAERPCTVPEVDHWIFDKPWP
jgi:hypothetical protein